MIRGAPHARHASRVERPLLPVSFASTSGPSRRTEAYLAQVLQRSHSHETFRLRRIDAEQRPDLVEHFRVSGVPALLVVGRKRVQGRLEQPQGAREIAEFLARWLRRPDGKEKPLAAGASRHA